MDRNDAFNAEEDHEIENISDEERKVRSNLKLRKK